MDSTRRKSTFCNDEASCDKRLEVPLVPPQTPEIILSNCGNICEPPQTDPVNEELKNYDNHWFEKLSRLDDLHSARNNLDIREAEKMLKNVAKHSHPSMSKKCLVDPSQLADCYAQSKGNILLCNTELEEFTKCIDHMLYNAVRTDTKDLNKKLTYAEKFKRGY